MKKTVTIISLSVVLIAMSAFAFQNDPKATQILNQVSNVYKSYKTIKAAFKVTVKNQQDNSSIVQKGTIYLKKKKFKVVMNNQEIYCDGKTLWTYLKDQNEVQITKYDPSANDINPSEIFTVYKKGFHSKLSGEELHNGAKHSLIELTPTDKNKPYFKLKLLINKLSKRVSQMTILNKNGMRTQYDIDSFTPNITIKDSFFTFDKASKPGVVVVDLR